MFHLKNFIGKGLFVALQNSFLFLPKIIKFQICHLAQIIVRIRISANGSASGCERPNVCSKPTKVWSYHRRGCSPRIRHT
jgi:hypothetical protein